MSSVKCPQCSLTNWSTAITCKRCGDFLQSPDNAFAPVGSGGSGEETQSDSLEQNFLQPETHVSNPQSQWTPPARQQNYQEQNQNHQYGQHADQPSQFYDQPGYAAAGAGSAYHPNLKTGLALASMILGIVGFMGAIFMVGILVAPVGLILGIVALVKTNRQPHVYGGKGFAIAGIVTSSLVVLFVPLVAAIAIPNLLAARRAANEGMAITTVKNISGAEKTYMASSNGKCGDVQTLIATRMLDVSLASGEKSGYRFIVINLPAGGCEIHATPLSLSHGTRSFYYSTEDGIIRGGPKKGAPADKNDFPLRAGS